MAIHSLKKGTRIFEEITCMKNVFTGVLLFVCTWASAQQDTLLKKDPNAFEKAIQTPGIQVLDVRTSGEFTAGHIKNALQADWTNKEQFNDRIQYVDKDKPVYVYCLGGGRSGAAATWMRNNGYKNVFELQGGINAWKKADKPLESVSTEKQISLEEYLAQIPAHETTLVDIGANWCPPCVKMEPILNTLQQDPGLHFKFLKVDASVNTDVLKALNIDPLPVFIIYKNGKETWRKQGIVDLEEFKTLLK